MGSASTKMMEAIEQENIKMLRKSIKNGADVNYKNNMPIQKAIRSGNKKIIDFLIENGVSLNTAVFYADMYGTLDIKEYISEKTFDTKLTLIDTLTFLKNLEENKIEFNICDIGSNKLAVKNTRTLKKDRTSSTSIFTNIILDNTRLPIAMKVFINSEDTAGFLYEAKIYKEIFQKIIRYDYSPNFASYIGFAQCKSNQLKQYKLKKSFDDTEVCVLLTERIGNGINFGYNEILPVSTISSLYSTASLEEFQPVMFQVCYSLHLLQHFRIVHNDLHSKNILVMELPKEIEMLFIINEKHYRIVTKFIPYLFDWDFAYAEFLGDNESIKKFNFVFNKFSKKFDLYTLLCSLDINSDKFEKKYPFVKYIENEKYAGHFFQLPYEQGIKLFKYEPYAYEYHDDANPKLSGLFPLFKFSYTQFNEIIPDIISKDVTHIFLYVIQEQGKGKNRPLLATIYTGAACRPTMMSVEFPTPLEYIEENFYNFEVEKEYIPDTKYIYTIPKSTDLIVL